MATVAEFLRAGTSLLQAVVGNGAETSDVGRWIEHFEDFVTRLNHEMTVDTAVEVAGAAGVEKGCWKISQDVLIRLRRLTAMGRVASSDSNDLSETLRSVFTEQDIESLRTQLFGIHMRWQSLRPEAETPL